MENYITYMDWSPNSKSGNEILAIGTSEGVLKLISKAGKTDKTVNDAHNTAVNKTLILRLSVLNGQTMELHLLLLEKMDKLKYF